MAWKAHCFCCKNDCSRSYHCSTRLLKQLEHMEWARQEYAMRPTRRPRLLEYQMLVREYKEAGLEATDKAIARLETQKDRNIIHLTSQWRNLLSKSHMLKKLRTPLANMHTPKVSFAPQLYNGLLYVQAAVFTIQAEMWFGLTTLSQSMNSTAPNAPTAPTISIRNHITTLCRWRGLTAWNMQFSMIPTMVQIARILPSSFPISIEEALVINSEVSIHLPSFTDKLFFILVLVSLPLW